MQDRRRFSHFAMNVDLPGPDHPKHRPGSRSVDDRQPRTCRGKKTRSVQVSGSVLLAQHGRLSAHVRSRNNSRRVVELFRYISSNKRFSRECLNHRVPAVFDLELIAIVKVRPRIIPAAATSASARGHQVSQPPGRGLELVGFFFDRAPDLQKQLALQFTNSFLGSEHLCLPLFELRRCETLSVRQRLPPVIIVRHPRGVGLRDLDIIAEDIIKADFKICDPGTIALTFFKFGDQQFGIGS